MRWKLEFLFLTQAFIRYIVLLIISTLLYVFPDWVIHLLIEKTTEKVPCIKDCFGCCVHAQTISRVWIFVTPWTMRFSRQEYWCELLFPPSEDLPDQGIKPMSPASPALAGEVFTTELPGKPFLMLRIPITRKILSLTTKKINAMIKPTFKIILKLNMYVKCIEVFNNRKEKRKEKKAWNFNYKYSWIKATLEKVKLSKWWRIQTKRPKGRSVHCSFLEDRSWPIWLFSSSCNSKR